MKYLEHSTYFQINKEMTILMFNVSELWIT